MTEEDKIVADFLREFSHKQSIRHKDGNPKDIDEEIEGYLLLLGQCFMTSVVTGHSPKDIMHDVVCNTVNAIMQRHEEVGIRKSELFHEGEEE